MKKRWVFITLLVGALALGITGGAVLAQGTGTSGATTPPLQTFAARVAAILGIDQAKVQDAMKQAATAMQNDALQQRLDKMVQSGRLTQAQADQIKQWYQSRPDVLGPVGPMGGRGFHRGMMRGGFGGFGMGSEHGAPPASNPPTGTSSNTSF